MGNKIPYCFLFYNDENSDSKIDKINEVDLGDRKILQSVISSNEKGFSKNQTFEAQKFPLSSLKLNLVNYTFYPHGFSKYIAQSHTLNNTLIFYSTFINIL